MIGIVGMLAIITTTCYQSPVAAPVVDPFRAPACSYCPGNRGLEYQTPAGTPVRAAASGVVRFTGVVAGVRYVVVRHDDGLSATYGRLASAVVVVGEPVAAGRVVGTSTNRFFFGLRAGDRYIDPAPFLGVLRYRPRLVPADGSAPRRAPPPAIHCAAAPQGWVSAGRRR